MRTHSQLVIDVSELLESPGSQRPLAFATEVPGLDAGLSHARPDLDLDLVAEAIDGGVWVKGDVSGRYHAECPPRRTASPLEADGSGSQFDLPAVSQAEASAPRVPALRDLQGPGRPGA